jgi:hypothetical protein
VTTTAPNIEQLVAGMQATDMGLANVEARLRALDDHQQRTMYPHGPNGIEGPRVGIPAHECTETEGLDDAEPEETATLLVIGAVLFITGIAVGVWLAGIAAQIGG